jgi:hypothetical protein
MGAVVVEGNAFPSADAIDRYVTIVEGTRKWK